MKNASFFRVYELDRWIQQGKLESAEQAAREFEVSARTIERDLDELRNLGAEIVYSRSKGCYSYKGERVTLPAQWMSEKELAIILISERALKVHAGMSFHSDIHPAFNRLLNPVRHDAKMMSAIRNLCGSVIFRRPYKAERSVSRIFQKLLDAIMDKKRVSIGYKSAEAKITVREVDPYVLVNDGGDWYLIGFCKLRNSVRTFALDRIYNPRVLDHYFALPKGFKAEEYLEQGFGRMRGLSNVDIRLNIDGKAAAWVERNVWHPSQKVEHRKNGSIDLSLTCPMTDNLIRWVLQMGGEVTVLAPQELKIKVKDSCLKLIERN